MRKTATSQGAGHHFRRIAAVDKENTGPTPGPLRIRGPGETLIAKSLESSELDLCAASTLPNLKVSLSVGGNALQIREHHFIETGRREKGAMEDERCRKI